jgi:deoxycytidylate deaminase
VAVDMSGDQVESELVIGLVSAVGTETNLVLDLLKERLGAAGYDVVVVKLSKDVIPIFGNAPAGGSSSYDRISGLMRAGNLAREKVGDNAILAFGAAACIRKARSEEKRGKTAYVIDSLKRPEEVVELRLIYPSGFILLGVHCEQDRRVQHLEKDLGISEENARDLVLRDAEEIKEKHGQRVNDTFHLADFFVQISENLDRLRCDVKRMVELWFGNPFLTPTFDEHAMFLAFAAALRSADLSRQVGAVVARNSQVLATGANDCPKAGGGLYWPTRQSDGCVRDDENGRDYLRTEGDSNRAEQVRIIDRIVTAAQKAKATNDAATLRQVLEQSGIRDLTEFGRVVHAEMEALLSCARNGLSVVGGTLYSTTFPCHNCAKHIVASGIARVVYVEPYPKSKATEFHDDSIAPGLLSDTSRRVRFEPFVGIGPRRFFELFSMNLGSTYPIVRKVKATGRAVDWHIEKAQLRIQMKPISYQELEALACEAFGKATEGPRDEVQRT